jgi:hypothetical protein
MLLMVGAGVTVKVTPLLDRPAEVLTTTGPVVTPVGSMVLIEVLVHCWTEIWVPLRNTDPGGDEPKPVPVIVTVVPTAPEVGEMLLM